MMETLGNRCPCGSLYGADGNCLRIGPADLDSVQTELERPLDYWPGPAYAAGVRQEYGLTLLKHLRDLSARLRASEQARERLEKAAWEVVNEYESHGGEGTHQECVPGAGCCLMYDVKALRGVLEVVPQGEGQGPGAEARFALEKAAKRVCGPCASTIYALMEEK